MTWKEVNVDSGLRQSMIKSYQRCPKQFEFVYIKGKRQPPNLKLTVGTAVHKGVEVNYAQKLKTKKDCKLDVVLDATSDEFKEAVKRDQIKASKKELDTSRDESIIMAGAYHKESAPTLQPVVLPEYKFNIDIPGAKLKFEGTIDLIAHYLKRNQALTLSDTKTTRRAYDQKRADVDTQLTAYSYAMHKTFKKMPKLVMFDTVILSGKSARSQHVISIRTLENMKRFEDTFRAVEKGITLGVFPPTDNEQTCSWCGFRAECHKGRAWSA